MALRDELKDKIKSFARDNLGIKSWKDQIDENFANGEEVALMNGFTRKAQDLFTRDLIKQAIGKAKPKKLMPGNKIDSYTVPGDRINYYHDDRLGWNISPKEYETYLEEFNNGNSPSYRNDVNGNPILFDPSYFRAVYNTTTLKPKEFDRLVAEGKIDPNNPDIEKNLVWKKKGKYRYPVQNSLTPTQTAPIAEEEFINGFNLMPEDVQDAWLLGQRNLGNSGAPRGSTNYARKKGDMNTFYGGSESGYVSSEKDVTNPGWGVHTINIQKESDPTKFATDVYHEGGHRSVAGQYGGDEYSVYRGLAIPLKEELIDEISKADNPQQMVNDIAEGNDAMRRWLSDAAGLNPDKRESLSPTSMSWHHDDDYADEMKDIYMKHIPEDMPGAEIFAKNAALSAESMAEIYEVLATPGGLELMQRKAPKTLDKFLDIVRETKMRAEDHLGPDGAVPERYNVNFHPELGD